MEKRKGLFQNVDLSCFVLKNVLPAKLSYALKESKIGRHIRIF